MLFHRNCIEKTGIGCRKIKVKKERIYTYTLCLTLKPNTIYVDDTTRINTTCNKFSFSKLLVN